jgi:hypothetical protein
MSGLIALAVILLVVWLIALVFFKIAGFAIHLLLIIAVVLLVLHFLKRVR